MMTTEGKMTTEQLAIERTVMAANRTLMAWIRTALSLISFGFTIYKFMQAVAADADVQVTLLKNGPRRLGLFLIMLGTASVIMGSLEYFDTIRRLNQQASRHYNPRNYTFILGLAIGLLGLFLLITILTHTEVF